MIVILARLCNIKFIKAKKDKANEIDFLVSFGNTYKKLFNIIFDKDVRFFVDTDKIVIDKVKTFCMKSDEELDFELLDLLTKLASGEFRGNDGISKCSDFANQLDSSDEIEMFTNILDNKLRLGIGATDINKLCKNLTIDQFEVMFAQQYKKVKIIDWKKEHYIQPKIDGMRCIGIKEYQKGIKFYSRTGEPITSIEHLEKEINSKCLNENFVLDGEIESGTSLEETGAIRRKDEQVEDAVYTLFGIYKFDEWQSKQHAEPYSLTYAITKDFLEDHAIDLNIIRLIPTYVIRFAETEEKFHELVTEHYQEFIEQGYEGAVLKTADHVYQPSAGSKRSNDWIKIKPQETTEGIIVDILEGKGDHQGLVGKFMVKWLNVEFEVAPGNLNHESRKRIWENKDSYLGYEIEFKYQLLSIYGVPRHASAIKIRGK